MESRKAPINTSDTDPLQFLVASAALGGSSAIDTQSKQGQRSFVASDTLPTDMSLEAKEALESSGVVFHGVVPNDLLFQYCTFPPGWRKVQDNMYWSNLLDQYNRTRASIFYKAAFYDRSSHLNVVCRYKVTYDTDNNIVVGTVLDGKKILYKTEGIPIVEGNRRDAVDTVYESAKAWATEHFPKWNEAGAYWDAPSIEEEASGSVLVPDNVTDAVPTSHVGNMDPVMFANTVAALFADRRGGECVIC